MNPPTWACFETAMLAPLIVVTTSKMHESRGWRHNGSAPRTARLRPTTGDSEPIHAARVRVGMEHTFTKPPSGPSVVARNIEALLQRQSRDQQSRTLQQRIADAVTAAAGSLPFVYVHLGVVILWVLVNVGWTPLKPFDPTFVLLATAASVEAIFLSTFVLVTQNRMQREADRRADLDLQISLLTEHELTRTIQLVNAIAAKVGAQVPIEELEELQRDVSPEQVLDAIDKASINGPSIN